MAPNPVDQFIWDIGEMDSTQLSYRFAIDLKFGVDAGGNTKEERAAVDELETCTCNHESVPCR